MSRSTDQFGHKLHTPNNRVLSWRKRGAAMLTSAMRAGVAFRLQAEDRSQGTNAELMVLRLQSEAFEPASGKWAFSADWLLRNQRGNNPALVRVADRIIHIAGFPAPDTVPFKDGEQRFYRDMVFLGGELAIGACLEPVQPAHEESFRLGKLIGLSIVTPDQEYPVWPHND
jgi:hypothetical protein